MLTKNLALKSQKNASKIILRTYNPKTLLSGSNENGKYFI